MEIRLARPGEANVLGAILADALGEDPIFRWLIPAGPRRDRRLLMFFTAMSSSYLHAGKAAYLVDDDAGAALWSDPGTTWRLQLDLGQIRAVFGSFTLRRVVRGAGTHLDLEKRHPTEPHWYLGFLGCAKHSATGAGAARCSERCLRERTTRWPRRTSSQPTSGTWPSTSGTGSKSSKSSRCLAKGPASGGCGATRRFLLGRDAAVMRS